MRRSLARKTNLPHMNTCKQSRTRYTSLNNLESGVYEIKRAHHSPSIFFTHFNSPPHTKKKARNMKATSNLAALAVILVAAATAHFAHASRDPMGFVPRESRGETPVVTEKVFFDITIGGEWNGGDGGFLFQTG